MVNDKKTWFGTFLFSTQNIIELVLQKSITHMTNKTTAEVQTILGKKTTQISNGRKTMVKCNNKPSGISDTKIGYFWPLP